MIPDIKGKYLKEALEILDDKDIKYKVEKKFSFFYEKNTVIGTCPSTLKGNKDDVVTVYVSKMGFFPLVLVLAIMVTSGGMLFNYLNSDTYLNGEDEAQVLEANNLMIGDPTSATVDDDGTINMSFYTVNYIIDGEVYYSIMVSPGSKIENMDAIEKDGLTFKGWYYKDQLFDFDEFFINNSIDLVAVYE